MRLINFDKRTAEFIQKKFKLTNYQIFCLSYLFSFLMGIAVVKIFKAGCLWKACLMSLIWFQESMKLNHMTDPFENLSTEFWRPFDAIEFF